jgi:hypothetical protein
MQDRSSALCMAYTNSSQFLLKTTVMYFNQFKRFPGHYLHLPFRHKFDALDYITCPSIKVYYSYYLASSTCTFTCLHTDRHTRCDQKIPRLTFYSAVGTLRDTQGQTVNQQFYLQVLQRLRLAVSHKRPQKRVAGAWALHHDNAPAHTAHSCRSATTLLP